MFVWVLMAVVAECTKSDYWCVLRVLRLQGQRTANSVSLFAVMNNKCHPFTVLLRFQSLASSTKPLC